MVAGRPRWTPPRSTTRRLCSLRTMLATYHPWRQCSTESGGRVCSCSYVVGCVWRVLNANETLTSLRPPRLHSTIQCSTPTAPTLSIHARLPLCRRDFELPGVRLCTDLRSGHAWYTVHHRRLTLLLRVPARARGNGEPAWNALGWRGCSDCMSMTCVLRHVVVI